jgi:hypothetical protein
LADPGSEPRRLKVEEFFGQVIAEVSDLPPDLADRLRAIVSKSKQAASAHVSIQRAIEDATRGE